MVAKIRNCFLSAENRRTGKKLRLHTMSFDDVAYAIGYIIADSEMENIIMNLRRYFFLFLTAFTQYNQFLSESNSLSLFIYEITTKKINEFKNNISLVLSE